MRNYHLPSSGAYSNKVKFCKLCCIQNYRIWSVLAREQLFLKYFINVNVKLPRMSSSVLSCSNMNGSRCGIVVFGACGLVHSFILFKVGRSLASKLKALSVNFWRRTCQVDDSLRICKNKIQILVKSIINLMYWHSWKSVP